LDTLFAEAPEFLVTSSLIMGPVPFEEPVRPANLIPDSTTKQHASN